MLKERLDSLGVTYTYCNDIDVMVAKGIMHAPVLETDDGILLGGPYAVKYVSSLEADPLVNVGKAGGAT